MQKIAVFGESGHAQDIASVINANASETQIELVGEVDEAKSVEKLVIDGFRFIIGIGDNKIRKKIAERYAAIPWTTVISSGAHVPSSAVIENGVFVGFGVYLSYNVHVKEHSIVHCNSVIGHDTKLEAFSQICPGVCIGGNGVTVGEGALIGTNATILNKRLTIGAWSKVSLASVVTNDIQPGHLHQTVNKKVVLRLPFQLDHPGQSEV